MVARPVSVRGATLWSMSAQYVVFATNFVVSVLISRFFLAPAEVGVFSLALSAAMLVAVLQDFGITRYLVGHDSLDDRALAACASVSLMFSAGIGLLILALAWPAAWFYGDARLAPLLCIIAASYLIVPFTIVPVALLQREMDFRALFTVNVAAAIANAVVALGLAAYGFSAFALAWAALATQGVRAVLARLRCGRAIPLRLTLAGIGPVLRFGSGSSLLTISGAVGTRTPELIIGRVISVAAVGIFGRATGLAEQLRTLTSGAAAGVFYAAFTRIRARGEDLAEPYLRVVAGYSAVTWPAMLFLAAASTPLVLALYGPLWIAAAAPLAWVALAQIAFVGLPLHVEIPILTGRMTSLLKINLVDTAISLVTLGIGAHWGVEAAAASRLAYALLWFGLYALFLRRLIGFRFAALAAIYLRSLALGMAAVLPLLLVYRYATPPAETRFAVLAAAALAGALAWLAALFAVRHPTRHEIAGIWRDALAGLRKRQVPC